MIAINQYIFISNKKNITLYMRVLLIIIYNKNVHYDKMLELQRLYIHTHENIDAYFVNADINQQDEVVINDDIVTIKCDEHIMTVLEKTIKCIEYLTNIKNYDYIIRSNISSVLKLNEIYAQLLNYQKNNIYCGGYVIEYPSPSLTYGIDDIKYEKYNLGHLRYIQGTFIVMSIDVVNVMLQYKHMFDYTIVDDVAIGIFFKTYYPNTYKNMDKYNISFDNDGNYSSSIIRNKIDNRDDDIINIKKHIMTYLKSLHL